MEWKSVKSLAEHIVNGLDARLYEGARALLDILDEKLTKAQEKETHDLASKGEYDHFVAALNEAINRRFRGDSKSMRQFGARRKEGYVELDMINAARACASLQYFQEHPEFLTPEFITRSDKLAKYLELHERLKRHHEHRSAWLDIKK